MKITKSQLKQIIKEELESVFEQTYDARAKSTRDLARSMMNIEKPYESEYAKKRRLAREKARIQQAMGNPSEEDQKRALELAKQHDRNKQESLQEDGHEDASSARRAMKTIIEDAVQMLQALEQMDGHLPTWWTNKMAIAANNLNKMRDYLLVDGD